jgi:hypothetical protein
VTAIGSPGIALGATRGPQIAPTRLEQLAPLGWNQSNLLGQDRFLNDRHWSFDPFRPLRTHVEIDADEDDDERRDVGMQPPKILEQRFYDERKERHAKGRHTTGSKK